MQEEIIEPGIVAILYKIANAEALSSPEQQQLNAWMAGSARKRNFVEQIKDEESLLQAISARYHFEYGDEWLKMKKRIAAPAPVRQFSLVRFAWVRYAAAVILLLSAGYFTYQYAFKNTDPVVEKSPEVAHHDVLPGSNKAILTLSNGQQIILDSLHDGIIAREGNANISKLSDGRLAYLPGQEAGAGVLNTMSTPKGGQYQLRLPDGTSVWLNAASSITYPTSFSGNSREVSISGEVYFEVAKDTKMPFRIKAREGTEVEVLGTHFNINAYPDEDAVRTTLLEGSVALSAGKKRNQLRPGQQAESAKGDIVLKSGIDTDQVTAWKNGRFNFEGQNLKEVMRQLSRWYDISIQYNGPIPDLEFGGEMGRNLTLLQALNGLGGVGVKFKIDGRMLTVL